MASTHWPPHEDIVRAFEAAPTWTGAAERIGRHRRSLQDHVNRTPELRVEVDRILARARESVRMREVTVDGDTATITEPLVTTDEATHEELADTETLMLRRGLDPAEWHVRGASITEWGRDPATGKPYRRLRVDLVRRSALDILRPASDVRPVRRLPRTARRDTGPRLAVVLTDPHCPYHDPALDRCVEAFLRDVRPDVGVIGGDGMDLPTLSRHKPNPAYAAPPQDCVQSFYEWTRRKVEASPGTAWEFLPGNHDQRLRDYVLGQAERAYGLAPASIDGSEPEPETLGDMIRRLCHFDALGVRIEAPPRDGEYTKAEVRLAPKLGVRHGDTSGKDHARKMLDKHGYSLAFGHDHRQGVTYLTRWDHDGHKQLVAIGAGCLCIIEDGLGYCDRPDWQQGFATVSLWPDGTFNVEHAVYTAGALRWRDRCYTP